MSVEAIVMAGGFGTRLRPLTNSLPKPMVPMVGRPIMEHIIALLKRNSIVDLTTLLYFQPEAIVDYLGDGSTLGVKINHISATVDLGTAGSVAAAMRRSGCRQALVISGDVLTDIDLKKAIDFHRRKRSLATVVLTRVENPLSFGIVITDKKGRITRFLEKPGWGEVFSDTINTGIYILDKKVLEFIPEAKSFDFSKELLPLLLEQNKALYGFIADGYWKDVGSLDEYRQANMDILHGRVSVDIPGVKSPREGLWMGEGTRIDYTSIIEGTSVVGRDCTIEAGARVVNSIIGDRTVIEEGAVVIDSVLWNDIRIGRGASLQENVVADFTVIGEGAHLGEGAIVSDHCRVGRNSSVLANVKVWPHKHVDDDATLASSLIWGQRWAKNIFSTYGVTGITNLELTPEFAAKLGAAYGASLPKGSVVSSSRDPHKASRMINRALVTGILSTGVNVHDYRSTPMPVVRYIARRCSEVGGFHTRRSPMDPQLMDLKFFDASGLDLHPGQEKTIENLFFREDFARVRFEETGQMDFPAYGLETYQSGFMSLIDVDTIRKAGFKMVLDYSYGSPSSIFPAILGSLNCDVIALNANIDGSKTTRTEREFNESLARLSTIVKSLNADIGVLLDAGGEKIFLVDEVGDIIDVDTALNLVALLVFKTSKASGTKGSIAVPITASRSIELLAQTYGFSVVKTKTATRGLMEAALAEDTLFVGENSGGFIFAEFQPVFDGMFAIAKILEMLAASETLLHSLVREIPPSIMVRERVPCSWEHKGMIMRRLAEDSANKKMTLLDGIRIDMGDDWVIAYPNQNHPYFHILAEASTDEKARELVSIYSSKIKKWQHEKPGHAGPKAEI